MRPAWVLRRLLRLLPSRQGYVNMTGTFFDTMIVCMLTALVISSSGVLGMTDPETGKMLSGAQLTIAAFSTVFGPYGKLIVSISLTLFAFSTIRKSTRVPRQES